MDKMNYELLVILGYLFNLETHKETHTLSINGFKCHPL